MKIVVRDMDYCRAFAGAVTHVQIPVDRIRERKNLSYVTQLPLFRLYPGDIDTNFPLDTPFAQFVIRKLSGTPADERKFLLLLVLSLQ